MARRKTPKAKRPYRRRARVIDIPIGAVDQAEPDWLTFPLDARKPDQLLQAVEGLRRRVRTLMGLAAAKECDKQRFAVEVANARLDLARLRLAPYVKLPGSHCARR